MGMGVLVNTGREMRSRGQVVGCWMLTGRGIIVPR